MDEKKSGRPKKLKNPKTISFKVDGADYDSLKDYAASCGQTVSEVLVEYVTGLVTANKKKIAAFRRQKNSAVKATFLPSTSETPPPKKSARTSKKPAQVVDEQGDNLKGGEADETP